ncbi:MAG: flavodoxin family protein [bacterium]
MEAIVYYSLTGNTKKAAEILAGRLNLPFEIIRIREKKKRGFLINAITALFKIRVEIDGTDLDLTRFDKVYFGSPVWAGSPAPALNTFLQVCTGLEGKEVSIFVTYGSGLGKERALKIMQNLIRKKGAKVIQNLSVR